MSHLASRRIVVTGGAGFLGRHVIAKLQEMGCRDLFVPRSAVYDLTKLDAVVQMYERARPQVMIHLAAKVGGIAFNKERPAETLCDNLMMGLLLMEQGRRYGLERFLAVSSVCAYPRSAPVPFREDDLWNGYPEETNGPYGVAKRVLTLQAQVYRRQYGFNAVSCLLTNLYGPGANFDPASSHVVPALIRKCVEAVDEGRDYIEIWGTGKASREFLYVEDAAEAIVLASERYEGAEPINIGSGTEVTIRELVEHIAGLAGFGGRIIWDDSRPEGQPQRCIDTARAERELGFTAKTPLEVGLRDTIDWYRAQQRSSPTPVAHLGRGSL